MDVNELGAHLSCAGNRLGWNKLAGELGGEKMWSGESHEIELEKGGDRNLVFLSFILGGNFIPSARGSQ